MNKINNRNNEDLDYDDFIKKIFLFTSIFIVIYGVSVAIPIVDALYNKSNNKKIIIKKQNNNFEDKIDKILRIINIGDDDIERVKKQIKDILTEKINKV